MTNSCYNYSSEVYDQIKSSFWGGYINLIEKANIKYNSVLDMGCGTGLAINYLDILEDQYVGIDYSESMLMKAKLKYPEYNFVHGSITDFQFKRHFDLVLCAFDTINHILEKSDWRRVFQNAYDHMTNESNFIFDVVTQYDHINNWNGQTNITKSAEWIFDEKYDYDKREQIGIINSNLSLYRDNQWIYYNEIIKHKAYPQNEIVDIINEIGLYVSCKVDLVTGEKPVDTSNVIVYICKKR